MSRSRQKVPSSSATAILSQIKKKINFVWFKLDSSNELNQSQKWEKNQKYSIEIAFVLSPIATPIYLRCLEFPVASSHLDCLSIYLYKVFS